LNDSTRDAATPPPLACGKGLCGPAKIAIVVAGYVAAWTAASTAVALRVAHTSGPDAQASSGMYAFGDGLVFLYVFAVVAVFPTCLGFLFLRPLRRFWSALALFELCLAATGLAAVALFIIGSVRVDPRSTLALLGAVSVLRLLVTPLFAVSFTLSGLFAPAARQRQLMFIAAAMEILATAYVLIHFFAPFHFF
jgi:hypothetical protein